MRANHQKIASLIDKFRGRHLNAHYLGYFACFNRQLYFEAHEVLEQLWLKERGQPEDLFYKGLIQLAGALVHLQKSRRGPAIALFGLARQNLKRYPDVHQQLDVNAVLQAIDRCVLELSLKDESQPLFSGELAPRLILMGQAGQDITDLF